MEAREIIGVCLGKVLFVQPSAQNPGILNDSGRLGGNQPRCSTVLKRWSRMFNDSGRLQDIH